MRNVISYSLVTVCKCVNCFRDVSYDHKHSQTLKNYHYFCLAVFPLFVSDLNCTEGAIYNPCTSPCPQSCGSQAVSDCSDATCVEACRCPDGQLLDRGNCVEPEECGCTLENGIYLPVREH